MRKAFSLIELVLVLTILAILATLAIPRLAATRDDALLARGASEVSAIKNAILLERSRRLLQGDGTLPASLDTVALPDNGNNRLFETILAPNPIFSATTAGHWLKTGDTQYRFMLNANENIVFDYNNTSGSFTCDFNQTLCQTLTQ